MLGIIIYLQIDRSVSADEFLMGMHIREPGAQATRDRLVMIANDLQH